MSARDVYDARGFGGRQGAGRRPAVVVVDFIEGFTNPASVLACDADAAVGATRQLLDAARATGVPVIFTTVCYTDDDRVAVRVTQQRVEVRAEERGREELDENRLLRAAAEARVDVDPG